MYAPGVLPADAPAWLARELRAISTAMAGSSPYVLLDTLYAAPKKIVDGMCVKADGTTWNPGSGAGVYVYRGAAWHFLG
jgi:hypothetical protein